MTTVEEYLADRHGRRYRDVAVGLRGGAALRAVLRLLSDAGAQRRMEEAEIVHGRPALAGVVADLEALPEVAGLLEDRDGGRADRFRQAVGVAVRIVMEGRGWSTTGRKGSLAGVSATFTRAERYRPPPEHADGYPKRVRRGLDAIAEMGSEEEQRETMAYAMEALQRTRREEGRVF